MWSGMLLNCKTEQQKALSGVQAVHQIKQKVPEENQDVEPHQRT
jgi:hypothetical protein